MQFELNHWHPVAPAGQVTRTGLAHADDLGRRLCLASATQEMNNSTSATRRQQNRNSFAWITQAVKARLSGEKAPSLLAGV